MKKLIFLTLTYLFIVTGCESADTSVKTTPVTPVVVNTTNLLTSTPTTIVDLNTSITNTSIANTSIINTDPSVTSSMDTNTALKESSKLSTQNEQVANTGTSANTTILSKVNMDKYVISSSKVSAIKAGMTSDEVIKEIGMEPYNPANTAIGKDKVTVSYYDSDYNPVNITYVNGVVESISK